MRNYLITALLALAALGGRAQQSGGNTALVATDGTPAWRLDLSGNDPTPGWANPDPAKFESSMFIMVKLEDELVPYSTDDDLMAVFINGECRTMPSIRNVDDSGIYFVLKIRGNSADRNVTFNLSYYCAALNRVFSIEGGGTFAAEITYGVDEEYEPQLTMGCNKYTLQNNLTVLMPSQSPLTPSKDDRVAAFVGKECRGSGVVGEPFVVHRTNTNETVLLRYYNAIAGGVFIQRPPVAITRANEFTTLTFDTIDVNGDGLIDSNDSNDVLDYLTGKSPDNFNASSADANGDGTINVADLVTLINAQIGNASE